jgi:hypothetical protein
MSIEMLEMTTQWRLLGLGVLTQTRTAAGTAVPRVVECKQKAAHVSLLGTPD